MPKTQSIHIFTMRSAVDLTTKFHVVVPYKLRDRMWREVSNEWYTHIMYLTNFFVGNGSIQNDEFLVRSMSNLRAPYIPLMSECDLDKVTSALVGSACCEGNLPSFLVWLKDRGVETLKSEDVIHSLKEWRIKGLWSPTKMSISLRKGGRE